MTPRKHAGGLLSGLEQLVAEIQRKAAKARIAAHSARQAEKREHMYHRIPAAKLRVQMAERHAATLAELAEQARAVRNDIRRIVR